MYVKDNDIAYFDSFGVEHISKEVIKFINGSLSITVNNFCIGFINFMFNGKSMTEYKNLFSPNIFRKNDDIILNYFNE